MTETSKKPGHPTEAEGSHAGFTGLDPNASISRKLRDYYGALQEEAIPDRFLDLLERLDAAERKAQPTEKT
ncbi:NepR family anti-sigma factor [Allorhizobium borbori]|uniref:Anti-sigma factor NepR domain-containing protein n=1 Tax=Allorhizobium borbori TaxID=485907 RepID=A0A7W6NZF4_9HYPH|nr:NepR family anti-sigma factor [Allorhizobium borbori]MBB4102169.1 hypothetical protein [Allorhizobium borbori]